MIHEVDPSERGCVVTYVDAKGDVACVTAERGLIRIPVEFNGTLQTLDRDLRLALDCVEVFGGIPIPVLQAILRSIEPAQAALDMALRFGNVTAPKPV